MIRFSCCLGNSIYLSDMSFDNNCIWICDLDGNVRKVAGVGELSNFSNYLGIFLKSTTFYAVTLLI